MQRIDVWNAEQEAARAEDEKALDGIAARSKLEQYAFHLKDKVLPGERALPSDHHAALQNLQSLVDSAISFLDSGESDKLTIPDFNSRLSQLESVFKGLSTSGNVLESTQPEVSERAR